MAASAFARHETFHPRYGWLKKGFDLASSDATVFLRDDAHVVLGVGKNMVRSIRYWCHAFKLLDEVATRGDRTSRPSALGRLLLGRRGLDPYLEDLGSLWLLHWQLLREPCLATAWRYAFFVHARPEISISSLTTGLLEYVSSHFPTARANESSLRKDAACVIRMYGELPSHSAVGEESIQCPFAELGLIRPSAAPKTFAFRLGQKPGLSSWIVAFACLDYAATVSPGAQTIALSRLLRGAGSPGLGFRLTESALYSGLEEATSRLRALSLSESAGVVQLSFSGSPSKLALEVLDRHFHGGAGRKAVA